MSIVPQKSFSNAWRERGGPLRLSFQMEWIEGRLGFEIKGLDY